MDLRLKRINGATAAGQFSYLKTFDSSEQVAVTVEHAYEGLDAKWRPILQPGRYYCKRGAHSLDGFTFFDTFEITGVIDHWGQKHTGILIHKGNTWRDSKGCVCCGMSIGMLGDDEAVLFSTIAFEKFMAMQLGQLDFWLTVED